MSPELFADIASRKKELIVNLAAEHSAHSRELKAGSVCTVSSQSPSCWYQRNESKDLEDLAPCSDFLFITFMTVMTKLVGKI